MCNRIRVRIASALAAVILGGWFLGYYSSTSENESRSPAEMESSNTDTMIALPTQEDSTPEEQIKYWFEVDVEDVHGQMTVLLNDYPVYETGHGRSVSDHIDLPMNTALVGEGNEYSLRIEPWMHRNGGMLDIGEVKTNAWVTVNEETLVKESEISLSEVNTAYAEWKERARARWKEYLRWEKRWLEKHPDSAGTITWKEGGALDSMRSWAERHPLTVRTRFDNESGPDYSRIFEEAPVLTDTSRLRDYAMHLQDLFAREDTTALYQAHRPRFQAIDFPKKKARRTIARNWLSYDWHVDFDRSDVVVKRWSGGRVWELYQDDDLADRLNKRALFLAGKDRLATWHEVYVAEIGGELKVVR